METGYRRLSRDNADSNGWKRGSQTKQATEVLQKEKQHDWLRFAVNNCAWIRGWWRRRGKKVTMSRVSL